MIQDSLNKVEAVEILYKGEKVENLSLTKFALWNKGRDTINNYDIAPKDPLKIVIGTPAKLLGADINYATNLANNFLIVPNLQNGEIKVDFDYFHTNEGIVTSNLSYRNK